MKTMTIRRALVAAAVLSGVAGIQGPLRAVDAPPAAKAAASLAETDLSGQWEVQIGSPAGAYASQMELRREGNGYRGTFNSPDDVRWTLEGTVKGDVLELRAVETGEVYPARLEGGMLRGTFQQDGATQSWTARRPRTPTTPGIDGRWKVTTEGRNGRTLERELLLTSTGDKVTGVLKAPTNLPQGAGGNPNSPWRRDNEIKEATFSNDELTFVTEWTTNNGNTVRRTYRGKLKGDTLEGTIEGGQGGPGGQGSGPRTWKATRIAPTAGDLAGTWDVSIVTPERTYIAVVTFTGSEGSRKGVYSAQGPENREYRTELKAISVDGSTVKYSVDLPVPNEGRDTLPLSFTGTRTGDTIKGDMTSPWGTSPFTMTRRSEAAAATGPAGEWVLTMTREGRTFQPTLALRQDGEKWAGEVVISRDGMERRIPVQNLTVDGEDVRFSLPSPPGGSGNLEFTGKARGDSISGSIKSSMGTDLVTGKRKKG